MKETVQKIVCTLACVSAFPILSPIVTLIILVCSREGLPRFVMLTSKVLEIK